MQYEQQNPEGLKLREYPRLADFAEVCEVISRCMGNPSDQFIRAYFANIELQTREVIESDLVGKAIEIFIKRYQKKNKASEWCGTISNLFEPLTEIAENNLKINIKNGKLWPQAPNSLSRKINEIKANLREIGIVVEKVSEVSLQFLYSKFLAYLIDQGSKVIKHDNIKTRSILLENAKSAYVIRKNSRLLRKKSIDWIDRLLQRPLPEHRKYCIWRILAPYFINVKRLSFDDSYDKIYQWLENCNELKTLDFDPATKINDSLNRAINTGYLPISLDNPLKEPRTLKADNKELYNIIKA